MSIKIQENSSLQHTGHHQKQLLSSDVCILVFSQFFLFYLQNLLH